MRFLLLQNHLHTPIVAIVFNENRCLRKLRGDLEQCENAHRGAKFDGDLVQERIIDELVDN